jgi:hypothetical protein
MGCVSRGVSRRDSRRWLRATSLVTILALTILVGVGPASAKEEEGGFFESAGIGLGTALVNVLYIPAKFTYATVGCVIGGLAWVMTLGDTDTAMGVWEPTMGGSYVVTPKMLRGDEPLEFSGPTGPVRDEVVEEREDVKIREYDTAAPAR